jgi:hypothetical protein
MCIWDCDCDFKLPSTLLRLTTTDPFLDVDLLYQQAPNLEELNLIETTAIRDRGKVTFPRLKKLRILHTDFCFLPHSLISNLEELNMMRCSLDAENIWDMPALRILALRQCENFTPAVVWNLAWELDRLIIRDSTLTYWDYIHSDQEDLIMTV